MIIPRKSIPEPQDQMTSSAINQHINVWERKVILRAGLIQISKVNTKSNLVILLGNKNEISQPLKILNH